MLILLQSLLPILPVTLLLKGKLLTSIAAQKVRKPIIQGLIILVIDEIRIVKHKAKSPTKRMNKISLFDESKSIFSPSSEKEESTQCLTKNMNESNFEDNPSFNANERVCSFDRVKKTIHERIQENAIDRKKFLSKFNMHKYFRCQEISHGNEG